MNATGPGGRLSPSYVHADEQRPEPFDRQPAGTSATTASGGTSATGHAPGWSLLSPAPRQHHAPR
jgi:hypothetical protein